VFETAELGHHLAKTEYRKIVPELRAQLLEAQYDLWKNGKFPVIMLISGVRGAGKGETVNLLLEWMDPRHIHTHAFDNPTDEELARPPMWRYWRALPPKGRIGILFGSWYTAPIIDRVFGRIKEGDLAREIDEINHFERMLADEGALILKFWFHLGKKRQRKRLKAIEADPETRWRITQRDWDFFKKYDRFYRVSEDTLKQTSTGWAPWIVVEGEDPAYRSVTVGQTLLQAMRKRLNAKPGGTSLRTVEAAPIAKPVDNFYILDTLDLTQALSKARPCEAAAAASAADAASALCAEQRRMRLRRHGCRRERRRDPAAHRGPRCAALSHHSGRGTDRRRESAALSMALLAAHPGQGAVHYLRSQLVWTLAGRAHRGLLLGSRLDACLFRDQRVRGSVEP
jgi:polyphosphate kinase 2 (PPK2 family)